MNKILTSIKKQLGISEEIMVFDLQIIMGINTAISALTQIGIGPTEGFLLITGNETWEDYLNEEGKFISVPMYIYCKTKLLFDPPANQTLLNMLQKQANELEWRLRTENEDG
jgi:hypothetical protein